MVCASAIRSLLISSIAFTGLSACTNSANDVPGSEPLSSVISKPLELPGDANLPTQDNLQTPQNNVPAESDELASTNNELAVLLHTRFIVEDQRVVPITGWICSDVFDEKRIYYFYPTGLLDDFRGVAVERTLSIGNSFEDITFFWSVSSSDSILMSSLLTDSNGVLLSSGQQYDMHSIRFTVVDNVRTFSALTLLRGKLVCAVFDLN